MGSSYKLDQSIPVQMPFFLKKENISVMMVPFFAGFGRGWPVCTLIMF